MITLQVRVHRRLAGRRGATRGESGRATLAASRGIRVIHGPFMMGWVVDIPRDGANQTEQTGDHHE